MEDILASIKRIIADDSQAATAAVSRVEAVASGAEPILRFTPPALQVIREDLDDMPDLELTEESVGEMSEEEVLELTQPVERPATPASLPEAESPTTPEPSMSDPLELGPAAAVAAHRQQAMPAFPVSPILSDDAAIASRQSLTSLSAMLVKPEEGSANTLEALVQEMLRPMMKEWLDQRLPDLVERLVEREIARITGRPL